MHQKTFGLIVCMVLVAGLVLSTACARQTRTVSADFPEGEGVTMEGTAERARPVGEPTLGERGVGDIEEGELPIRQTELARELLFEEASRELQAIYFDYDSSALKPEAKATLERGSDWLKRNPNVNVQIAGHCDERGTNEYKTSPSARDARWPPDATSSASG